MKKLILVGMFIVAWACTASHCAIGDYDYPMYLRNNSGQELSFTTDRNYPDTILSAKEITGVSIKAFSTKRIAGGDLSWESIYKTNYPSDTMSIFVLSADTLNKYTWERVRDDYNILIRYDLSLQDLKKMNFSIVYPPNEAMRDMHMWPPYGTSGN